MLVRAQCCQSHYFSTTPRTLGIIPLAADVVTTLCKSAKNSVREHIDNTTYVRGIKAVLKLATYLQSSAEFKNEWSYTLLLLCAFMHPQGQLCPFLADTFRGIRSRMMKLTGLLLVMGEKTNMCKILFGKPKECEPV